MPNFSAPQAPNRVLLIPDSGLVRRLQISLDELAPAEVTRWRPEQTLGFNVVIARPQSGSHALSVLYPMSFDYRIDPLVIRRLQILSAVTQRTVIGVETPGVTMNFASPPHTGRASMPFQAARAALRGDYSALAALQLRAAREVFGRDLAGSHVVGESLGAQLGSTIATHLTTTSLDVVEPVNAIRRKLRQLSTLQHALGETEALRRRDAILRNTATGWGDVSAFEDSSQENADVDRRLKRMSRQGRWALVSAIGLRRSLEATMLKVPGTTTMRLWRAEESLACTAQALDTLAGSLRESGHSVDVFSMALENHTAGHHILTDMNAMTAFAEHLRRLWGSDESSD